MAQQIEILRMTTVVAHKFEEIVEVCVMQLTLMLYNRKRQQKSICEASNISFLDQAVTLRV